MIDLYLNKEYTQDSFIGQKIFLEYISFAENKKVYGFLRKDSSLSLEYSFVYLEDKSILSRKDNLYCLSVENYRSHISSFKEKLFLYSIKDGKLEKKLDLDLFKNKCFKFVGFFK